MLQDTKTLKLLILENDQDYLNIIKSYLKKIEDMDFDIVGVSSGANGFKQLEKESYACLLVDYNLPDLNGIKFIQKLFDRYDELQRPPCILITGFGDEFMAVEALEQGFMDYLPKDKINHKSLCRTISNAVEKKSILNEIKQKDETQKVLMQKLEESNNQMRRFVGIVAHDLRNPLGNIINLCEIMNEIDDVEEAKEFTSSLKECGETAFELVNDLLDLTALETGKVKIESSYFDYSELIEKAVNDLRSTFTRKGIESKISVDANLETQVFADSKRIYQVLNNLVSNALKFTPSGGLIEVYLLSNDQHLVCGVRDTGVGIPAEQISKLFHKFEKTSTHGTDGEIGTGFGLPLAQELIKAHGSEILVQSKVNEGTTFEFELPIKDS